MAKVNAPLFSFNAAGKIANALVYFGWKGIDVVRSYVVPANPRTTAQTTQRGYLGDVVDKIHAVQAQAVMPLTEDDVTAYAGLGTTRPTPRTWFNEIVKNWLDVKVAGKVPCVHSSGQMIDKSALDARPYLYLNEEVGSTLAAGTFFLGTSRTALIKTKAAAVTAGNSVTLGVGTGYDDLTAGVKYYWQFKADAADGCEGVESGIYTFVAT